MNHKTRMVSQWEILRGFIACLFLAPLVALIIGLIIKYSDLIDNILK